MRWLVLLFLFPVSLGGQSVADFPRINSVSSVTVVEEMLFFNLSRVAPKPSFRDWWKEMEECTRISKPMGGIGWFVADAIYDATENGYSWGLYYFNPPEIIIIRNQTLEQLEDTVKHEILHHLIRNDVHEEKTFVRCLPQTPNH